VQLDLPLGRHTYTVSELGEEVRAFLGEAFRGVWVAGEVQRLRPSRNGHVFFELVEKGEGDAVVGKIEAVLWRLDHQRVRRELAATGQRLADGVAVRCLVEADFYPPAGRMQLTVREIDPVFSLGLLAQRRQETLAALAAAGLLERNRSLALPAVPIRIGLVTSHGSAAFHDFVATLRESGFAFQVLLVHAAVQGREAEREVAAALRALAALGVDCAALVRGGGARSDLAAFDSRRIAEAVALLPVPVLTGLGHEIDRSVTDLVAHTTLKTPTMVAEFLVRRVETADRQLAQTADALGRCARERLRRGAEAVGGAEQRLRHAVAALSREGERVREAGRLLAGLARQRLRHSGSALERSAARLATAAPRGLARRRRDHGRLAEGVARAGRRRVELAEERCAALARLAAQLDPQRVLQRGFSITRGPGGTVLRAAGDAVPGTLIRTQLAAGELSSRVEELVGRQPRSEES
jgi:exodeoxyribonuclease VII large subunit